MEWKDGYADWIAIKDLKASYILQVADYMVANNIEDEPALAWWSKVVLRKSNQIISIVKSRYWKSTHKFGIRLPKTVSGAFKLDQLNGNGFWRKSIELEMGKAKTAFQKVYGFTPDEYRGKKALVGYQEIKGH